MPRRKASAPRRRPVTPAAISVADPLANHATGALADDTRLSSHSLAQPLSPMAHGNLLGLPRGRDRLRRFLAVCVAAAGGFAEVFAVGGKRWQSAALKARPQAKLLPHKASRPVSWMWHRPPGLCLGCGTGLPACVLDVAQASRPVSWMWHRPPGLCLGCGTSHTDPPFGKSLPVKWSNWLLSIGQGIAVEVPHAVGG